MNKWIGMGRLASDPMISHIGDNKTVARYTIAVDRRKGKNQDKNAQTADFISLVAWDKSAEWVEKYLKKGTKILVSGRIVTGSYTNKDGKKVYTTDVWVDEQEFAESKSSQSAAVVSEQKPAQQTSIQNTSEWMNIPDINAQEEELPWQ